MSFDWTNGAWPAGNFYGTTLVGGTGGSGTVFKITSAGALTTLYSFDGADGLEPYAGLVQATDGNLYGTTRNGGAYCPPRGCGTIFRITPSGTLTTLHSFDGADGVGPGAGLVQATNGFFYGTTTQGGVGNPPEGTVFRLGMVRSCATCRP